MVYHCRGLAYDELSEYTNAIEDYSQAIRLNPDLVAMIYDKRGRTWLHLGGWGEAKSDLTTARDMGEDIIASFHNNYGSIAGFERIIGIKLPADLAAMLTPEQ